MESPISPPPSLQELSSLCGGCFYYELTTKWGDLTLCDPWSEHVQILWVVGKLIKKPAKQRGGASLGIISKSSHLCER